MAISIPSLVSSGIDGMLGRNVTLHEKMIWEKWANVTADKFWDRYKKRKSENSASGVDGPNPASLSIEPGKPHSAEQIDDVGSADSQNEGE